jgi:hypothetical protein
VQFLHQAQQERANIVHAARQHAGEIFHLDPKYFRSRFKRADIPELQELLQNPNKPNEKYPLWAPMIFPQRDCNSSTPFAVEELAKVSLRAHSNRTHAINYLLVP